ncbi:helicase C-terminal domain-containing protein [Clostridium perfringens]|nr:helicase C-terminal domain-containing protein [Clostridium perfringens]MDM0479959.1 helicase C-terminal domain-containing protein [Clostridium perfringens]MDM0485128.1 helicase C-terminal domain-containing protein [Clostridium perfringens]MDM0487553.1 helicase C-terminal domain-containing protein [Clostridium perfringens]
MKDELIKISIRNLVEFVLRRGSIDSRIKASVRALEGIKGHKKIQSSYSEKDRAEVTLKEDIDFKDFTLRVEGRADGILEENEKIIIDEIKTTTKNVMDIDYDFNELHWAQAKVYAYIYSKEKDLESIIVQLTYYNVEDFGTKFLRQEYSFNELKEFFYDLIEKYKEWILLEKKWIDFRNDSIENFNFPFESYRKGQRELAIRVYKAIAEGKKCFAEAPTGTGKTMSTLFPAVKALGAKETNKIFYITAKTTTREIANNTLRIMREKGLNIRSVNITAKEKCCKMEEKKCIPEYCPYANGYFDRVNMALKEALKHKEEYDLEYINKLSDEYNICPFEFSLELSNFCDVVICDYNYIFDPQASLKGILEGKAKDYTILIDEAHNLLDRGRSMYSSKIFKDDFLKLKREFKSKDKGIYNSLDRANKYLIEKRKVLENLETKSLVEKEEPSDLYGILRGFLEKVDIYESKSSEENSSLLELYFNVYEFLNICSYYGEDFTTLYKLDGNNLELSINCLDPYRILKSIMNRFKSVIIFSATLLPMEYFKELYGAQEGDYSVNLTSPFDYKNKLTIVGKDVSTTYSNRKRTLPKIVNYIIECAKSKRGNYLVFFPSYEYMWMVHEEIKKREVDFSLVAQGDHMKEEEKEEFLSLFKEGGEKTHLGLAVLGGHFSEGIDLTLDKLIGVIIIGVGMPKICLERESIKEYYNSIGKNGFDYAYVYPGIIKVLQAAGRCIRTERDKGVVLLLDDRYFTNKYKSLLPREWFLNILVESEEGIKKTCEHFWKDA